MRCLFMFYRFFSSLLLILPLLGLFVLTPLSQGWTQEVGAELFPFINDEKTSIKDPFSLRDPFKEEIVRSSTNERGLASLAPAQDFTQKGPQDIQSVKDIKVVGVLLGNERRAMVDLNGEIITLSEGMKVGNEGLELRAIMPGGIVFVEKMKNIYDQDEYIETIVPILGPTARN